MTRHRRQDMASTIRRVFRKSGMTQSELSQIAGVSQGNISRFLGGIRGLNLASVEKLAAALGLELREVGRRGGG